MYLLPHRCSLTSFAIFEMPFRAQVHPLMYLSCSLFQTQNPFDSTKILIVKQIIWPDEKLYVGHKY